MEEYQAGKDEESFSPYFEAENSFITINQTKENNTYKPHGVYWYTINRCKVTTRIKR